MQVIAERGVSKKERKREREREDWIKRVRDRAQERIRNSVS